MPGFKLRRRPWLGISAASRSAFLLRGIIARPSEPRSPRLPARPRRPCKGESFAEQSGPKKLAAPKPSKLGAEKLTPEEQRRRFIEEAREAGASENEAEFDRNLGALVRRRSE